MDAVLGACLHDTGLETGTKVAVFCIPWYTETVKLMGGDNFL